MRATPILKLSLLASAIALALPGTTYALGLGRLTLQSSLGQPLSAEIELTSASREEIGSLSAKIADAAVYRQNNLAYPGVLARARVTLERNASGQPILKVTTSGAVNEPYLDLLVEVNWAAGRTVRDYTFLLDPPGVAAPATVEPVAPVRSGAAPPRPAVAAPAAAPAAPAPAAAAAPAPAATAPAPAAAPRARAAAAPADSYTVRRGDTLSKIATEFLPERVTLDQMLVALFKANQDAFDGNNMNRLRAGSIVTIPGADDAAATAPGEATRIVKVQSSDWRGYRDRVAGAAPEAEGAAGRAAAGRIGAVVEEKAPAAPPGRDQLKVSREAGVGKGAGVATEDAIARDKQIKDAQVRIAELEKTLKDLQRAVELKSQTMAQLQAQADAAKGKAPEPPKAAAPAVPPPAAVAPEPAKAVPPPVAPPKVEAPAAPAAKVEAPAAPAPKAEAPAAPAPKAEAPAAPAPKAEPPKAPSAPPKLATKPEPSWLDDMMANTPTWAIGGGALAVLGGIAALIAARRRKSTKFEDSIVSGTDIKTNTVFGSTGGGVVNTGDNSLGSGFSNEGMGTIDTDEVDPIAEAEVYLAYGRDAQAEEILKDALKKDPQRQEIYLKLLEIHAQHNKPSAFETVASELYSVSQGQGETWQKAVALGRQLDPGNPMFAAGATGAAAAAMAAGGLAARGAPAAERAPSAAEAAELGEESLLDFKLDDEISMAPTPTPKPKSPADILAGAESELEKTAKGTPLPPAAIEGAVEKAKAAGLDITGAAAAAAAGAAVAGRAGVTTAAEAIARAAGTPPPKADLDFHLDEAEKPAPLGGLREGTGGEAAIPPAKLAQPQAAIDLDALDLSFGKEHVPVEDATPSVLDGQWHDAATKLDLAKAYQEMGDVEGAREILQEVLHEGDDQQKAEAQSLIAKLG